MSLSEKTRFFPIVFTKLHPHLFSKPDGLCGAFRGKFFTEENFAHFCIKHPRNCFSEWRVLRSYFFTKPPHNLFSGPNGICGTFRGKIVSHENFNHFYLKRPQNCFYEKHVFDPKFFTKLHPHLFSGPNGLCGSFQGKIVTEENSTRFCKKHP